MIDKPYNWNLPVDIEINGNKHPIRNNCDYRVVLDVICALNDNELSSEEKIQCALFIFYEDISKIQDFEKATKEMFFIINNGQEQEGANNKPPLMDWQHDFPQLAPPISRVLGYSVRDVNNYTHYYDFIGAYMEIGDCTFANIVSIRNKRMKGKKLERWEQEFYQEHKKMIDLPQKLTTEDEEWLDSDW